MHPLFIKHARAIVFVSFVAAVFTLFLTWDRGSVFNQGIGAGNAFSTGYWVYILFTIYPVYQIYKKSDVKLIPGIVMPYLAVLLPLVFHPSGTLTSTYSGTQAVNYSGVGTYLFVFFAFFLSSAVTAYYKTFVDDIIKKFKEN